MIEQIRTFLKSFAACPQLAKIYTFSHPEVERAMIKAHEELKDILLNQETLTIAIVEDEISSGEEIFFDLSKRLTSFIEILKSKNAEKILFFRGISYKEFKAFVLYFLDATNNLNSIDDYLNTAKITNIKVGIIRVQKDLGKMRDAGNLSFEEKYDDCFQKVSSSLMDVIDSGETNFAQLYYVIDALVKGIGAHYQQILKLVNLKGKDTITFSHMLNVSFLIIYFCKYLGFNKDETRDLGMAGLFHDIGKLYISNSILKGGKLTDEEFESIKSHSLLGAKLLLNFTDKIGVFAPVVAMEHHLRYDGTGGYPQLKYSHPLHLSSMMVSLCDVYDALSQRRSYKRDYPPEQIYGIMKEGRGTQFSPELFDAFFESIGVWPNGVIVQLSDQRIGVVENQNQGKIFSPLIKIISDDSNVLLDLSQDSSVEIKRSLNPYSDGKDYWEKFYNQAHP